VKWDMETGINTRPEMYHGLTADSSWTEFQEQNYNFLREKSGCPQPCAPGTCYEVLHMEGCDDYNEWDNWQYCQDQRPGDEDWQDCHDSACPEGREEECREFEERRREFEEMRQDSGAHSVPHSFPHGGKGRRLRPRRVGA